MRKPGGKILKPKILIPPARNLRNREILSSTIFLLPAGGLDLGFSTRPTTSAAMEPEERAENQDKHRSDAPANPPRADPGNAALTHMNETARNT